MKTILNIYSCNNAQVKEVMLGFNGHTVSVDFINNICQNLANIFGDFRIDIIFHGGDHFIWKFRTEERLRKIAAIAVWNRLQKVRWGQGMDYKDYASAIAREMNYLYYSYPLVIGHVNRHLSLNNGDAPRAILRDLNILEKFINS